MQYIITMQDFGLGTDVRTCTHSLFPVRGHFDWLATPLAISTTIALHLKGKDEVYVYYRHILLLYFLEVRMWLSGTLRIVLCFH